MRCCTNLSAQSLDLRVLLDLEVLVLLLEGLNDGLEVLVLPPRLQDLLLRPHQRHAVSLGLRMSLYKRTHKLRAM